MMRKINISKIIDSYIEQIRKWEGYEYIIDYINEDNTSNFYVAGGSIRDVILHNKKINDYDIFYCADNENRLLEKLDKYGQLLEGPFGLPRWLPHKSQENYADIIPISKFYNGLWKCRDIIDVLNQFDFTGNAIAINLINKTIYDPQNGVKDLIENKMKMIRFDYPEESINEKVDLSRLTVLWFRILHYASTLNLEVEKLTHDWLKRNDFRYKYIDKFAKYFFWPNTGYMKKHVY